jgi:coenzyme A diphosphatase NUDT7
MDFIEALAQFKPWRPSLVPEQANFKKSAILVPLQVENGKLYAIMTLRSKNLSRYSGDISFPGGMQDPSDDGDFVKTALREAEEEIGLKAEAVRLLCQLRPCITRDGIIVVPVVGLVTDSQFSPKLNFSEVEECFRIELNQISRTQITWKPITVIHKIPYNIIYIHTECERHETRRIWGLTANILLLLLLMNSQRSKEFSGIPITYLDIDLIPPMNKL